MLAPLLTLAAALQGAPSGPVGIYGGAPASACQWPTAVAVYDGGPLCSGVLIHPLVVAYAAHCGEQFTEVQFGEHAAKPARTVATAGCFAHPDADGTPPNDFAYCRLAAPVLDLPIAPPLVGCELEALVEGAPVTLVGFGEEDGGGLGDKFFVEAPVSEIPFMGSLALIGGDGLGTCAGDSGGPGYLQLADGSWRTVGVTFGTTLTCGAGTVMIPLAGYVGWLEEHSGLDVTPCHDAEGAWDPGPRCDHLATDPDVGGGAWAQGCDGAGQSGPGASCGEAWSAAGDRTPPTVTITAPTDGDAFPEPMVKVAIDLVADDGDGSGVDRVDVIIDGSPLGLDLAFPPYSVELTFPAGVFVIEGSARDFAGNVGTSAPVRIAVGDVDGGTTSTTGEESSSTGATTTGDGTATGGPDESSSGGDGTATGGPGGDQPESGCACRSVGGGGGAVQGLGVVLLGLVARRRRGR
ncbi:MAG: trypsin-like serine protease [Nannocystaceae bacterium]